MSNVGRVVQVMGPVVDIAFDQGNLPEILNAVNIEAETDGLRRTPVCEVQQHLGEDTVRTVAMSSTDGLSPGMHAVDTGGPISVPVGRRCWGASLTPRATPWTS